MCYHLQGHVVKQAPARVLSEVMSPLRKTPLAIGEGYVTHPENRAILIPSIPGEQESRGTVLLTVIGKGEKRERNRGGDLRKPRSRNCSKGCVGGKELWEAGSFGTWNSPQCGFCC